ncbi:MAG: ImmA/IrrE family metallo-endopeptidase [Proteobacteria bacterium]|nr:ImmA/IrrE family metallo-endopeptidase [Pseudomonadota bacterium]
MMNECFANNLKSARVKAGLSGTELCRLMNGLVSKQAISKYEKGQMMPDSTTLIALANALDVKVDYFFRSNHCQIEQVNYRKKQKFSKKQQDALTEQIKDLVERYQEIENTLGMKMDCNLPHFYIQVPDEIVHVTSVLKDQWHLGEDGICNLFNVLEEHGIKVILIEAADSFDGVSAFADNYPVIVLNNNGCSERMRFTALHELGHLILRFNENVCEKDQELWCHRFASEMLISSAVLRGRIGEKRESISRSEVLSIQVQFGISIDALLHRLKDMQIMSGQAYRNYCIMKNMRSDFRAFVDATRCVPETTNRFEGLVYRAFSNALITGSKAAELLNMPESEIHNRMKLA